MPQPSVLRLLQKSLTLLILLFCLGFFWSSESGTTAAALPKCPDGTTTCSDGSCCQAGFPVCCSTWCCKAGAVCGDGSDDNHKCMRVAGKSCQSCYNDYERDVKQCKDGDIKCVNLYLGKYKKCLETCEP